VRCAVDAALTDEDIKVLLYQYWIITCVVRQIETIEGRRADAPAAQAENAVQPVFGKKR